MVYNDYIGSLCIGMHRDKGFWYGLIFYILFRNLACCGSDGDPEYPEWNELTDIRVGRAALYRALRRRYTPPVKGHRSLVLLMILVDCIMW